MKTLLVAAAALLLAVPAALATPPAGHGNQGTPPGQAKKSGNQGDTGSNASSGSTTDAQKNAAKLCKAERESLGAPAFADKYGTNANKRNAFGKCVSQHAKHQGTVFEEHNQAKLNAAKVCKAERLTLGNEAFADKYGTNANKRNAFGKCVSQHAKTKSTSTSDDD